MPPHTTQSRIVFSSNSEVTSPSVVLEDVSDGSNPVPPVDFLPFGVALPGIAAKSEALNAKIQLIKYTARDYRNVSNFIAAIYFHFGALNMNPLAI